jgi:hypothetical protein
VVPHFHFRHLPGRYRLPFQTTSFLSVSSLFLDPVKTSDYRLTQQTRGLTDTLPKIICNFPRWWKPKR